MQPYFFPYVVYYALVHKVDEFYLYDDVNFITRGWVNRNRLFVNDKELMMTVPLAGASQNDLIQDVKVSTPGNWGLKLQKTIQQTYAKSPFFREVGEVILPVFLGEQESLVDVCETSITRVLKALDLKCRVLRTSQLDYNRNLRAQGRILEICRVVGATDYVNLPGGRELYSPELFQEQGLRLHFIDGRLPTFETVYRKTFKPEFSMVDTLLVAGLERTRQLVQQFEVGG